MASLTLDHVSKLYEQKGLPPTLAVKDVSMRIKDGHPALALSAAVWTFARSAPGALMVTSRWLVVTAKPSPTFSRATVAVAEMLCALMPAPSS